MLGTALRKIVAFLNAEGRQRVAGVPPVVATAVAQSNRRGTQSIFKNNSLQINEMLYLASINYY